MNNISIGNGTEKSVSTMLRNRGYWVYNCPRSSTGAQPVDLFAARRKDNHTIVWFIDGKHVRKEEVSFPINRIESNQWASLKFISEFAGMDIDFMGFAVQFERTGDYYWLPYKMALKMAENGQKSINLSEMKLFEEILNEYDN